MRVVNLLMMCLMLCFVAWGAQDVSGPHPFLGLFELAWGVGWGAVYTHRLGWFS